MDKASYNKAETYMLKCMNDSAHDKEHIYRVLYMALDIAEHQSDTIIDYNVLSLSCLLHDIGRGEQYANPSLCHAIVGSEKAYDWLINNGYSEKISNCVKDCIRAHRFRSDNQPQSIEAKILFDADKLDVTGAIGIARTLFYKGHVCEPLYLLDENENIHDGTNGGKDTFFGEYKYKLEGLYDKFYTEYASTIAKQRQQAAIEYHNNLLNEVSSCHKTGKRALNNILTSILL